MSQDQALKLIIDEVERLRDRIEQLERDAVKTRWNLSKLERRLVLRTRAEEDDEEYQAFRQMVLERDSWTCQDCGQESGAGSVVHHLLMQRYHPHLRCVVDNGITLCAPCHDKRHSGSKHPRSKALDPSKPI